MTCIPRQIIAALLISCFWGGGLVLSANTWSAVSGADIYKGVLEDTAIYDDPVLDAYIKELGAEIIAVSEMAGEKFTFTLLDLSLIHISEPTRPY